MAYDESRFRGEPGFRDEPDLRPPAGPGAEPTTAGRGFPAYPPGGYAPPGGEPIGDGPSGELRRGPHARLGDVFDDPEHGEPGRDRVGIHLVWELVLLLVAGALVYLLRSAEPAQLRGAGLRELFIATAVLGIVTVGMTLSLRAATPNLAVGPIMFGAALFFADNSDRGLLPTAGVTALLALGVGIVIAVFVVGFHVPAWAASLAAALGVIVWIQRHAEAIEVVNGSYRPTQHALYWFLGFAVLSILTGFLGLLKPVRRSVGRFRAVADPARRRGAAAGLLATLALAGSSVLAAGAGILVALQSREVSPTESGLVFTGLALGAALVGGTSVFGRRGGVLGTLLAVVIVVVLEAYATAENWRLSNLALAAALIGAGLIVSRIVEVFGRPGPPDEPEDEPEDGEEWAAGGPGSAEHTWSGVGWSAGGQPAARTAEDAWSGEDRWSNR